MTMKKTVSHAFGKDQYLLGKDSNGVYYWLEESTFDCGWYWGIGYIETFTNNENPKIARDINMHTHFDSLFFKQQNKNGYDAFKEFFTETVLTEKETWTLIELMKTLYTFREYSDTLNRGGSHYTKNPLSEKIKNESEYNRINKEVIPEILKEVYKLLGDERL